MKIYFDKEMFQIRIWEYDQDMSTANDTIIPRGRKLEAIIDNLSPGKKYHLRVLAFSNGGDGRMSSPIITFQMGMDIFSKLKLHINLHLYEM